MRGRSVPELDTRRSRRVAADTAVGEVGALDSAYGLSVNSPGQGVLLPINLRIKSVSAPRPDRTRTHSVIVEVAERVGDVTVGLTNGLLGYNGM